MKRFFLTLLLFAVAVCVSLAQNYTLQGKVVDAQNVREGLPSASVLLIKNDTVAVAGVATEEDGNFSLKVQEAGKYKVKVSFVGYETLVKRVELTKEKPHVKLGNLLLKQDLKVLKEVQVTGLAEELTIKADTFVYHASAFRVPEGSTIAALIKQLPGLSMDSDGNLTFQGKAVSSILVNGKPFLGDANTAMSNIVSDAVQDVAVYEKSDEEKEFAGVHDTEKATVVDLKIKKEYMASWNINADAGAGTNDKYIAKVFASNFTDKHRTAVYAQVNNISENQVVDENGNWRSGWGLADGIYTYRKAGAIMSWDNGKANTDAGLLKLNAEVELGHDNNTSDAISNVETILGNSGNHYSYQRGLRQGRNRSVTFDGGMTYNIDSLNRLTAFVSYRYNSASSGDMSSMSTYSAIPGTGNPEAGLVGDDASEELKSIGINSQARQGLQTNSLHNLTAYAQFVHRFRKDGYSLNIGARYDISSGRYFSNSLCDYRYFNSITPDAVDRRYYTAPDNSRNLYVSATLDGKFSRYIRFSATYTLNHEKNDKENNIYRLDRYAGYAQPGLPLGVRPSTADSLAAVIDFENSLNSSSEELMHSGRFYLYGVWDKFEATGGATLRYYDEKLDYARAGKLHTPQREYFDIAPMLRVEWKPVKNGELSLQYNGYSRRPSLLELLPVTDTSDQMTERVNNPDLKLQWNNHMNLYGRWFNEKRGDSYNIYANFGNYNNSIVDIIETDPLTGKRRHTKDNVNGCYYLSIGVGTEQPLDKEREWMLSLGAGYGINRNKSFVGATGDGMGLSVVHSYTPRANMRLKWRSGMWSVNLSGAYTGQLARYDRTPAYNQNGHTFECCLEPQADLPFGMKVNTSFMFYGRRGYADDIMNHDQWLWNVTVSQSFLKNKALTLQLEAVDILNQRTSEYSYVSPGMRQFSRNEVFLSYVMLHAIYRLNIGGK